MSFFSNILHRLFSNNPPAEPDPMKYLIAGLGNMDPEYDHTRHNIGFEVVDFLAKEFDVTFKNDSLGDLAEFNPRGRLYILLQPSTYMNRSGKAVRHWMTKKEVKKENTKKMLDDINLPFGKLRMRDKGSDGGHNGLKDIDQVTGGNNYARLRIGIGNDFPKGRQADYVLGKWSAEEAELLPNILKKAAEGVKALGTLDFRFAVNQVNGA